MSQSDDSLPSKSRAWPSGCCVSNSASPSAIAQDERDKQSAKICQRLFGSHLEGKPIGTALLSAPDEVDIKLLIEKGLDSGKTISLPRFEPRTKRYEIGSINGLEDVVEGLWGE